MSNLLDKLLLRETYGQIKTWVFSHKLISSIIILAVLTSGGFGIHALVTTAQPTSYLLGTVTNGTIMTTISGTGQISDSHQLDLQAKASGEVTAVNIRSGQTIKTGQVLVQIDSKDAQKSVRDAQLSLRSAQISLAQQKASLALSLTQSQNTLDQTQASLTKSYDDAMSTVASTYSSLPTIINGIEDIMYGHDCATVATNLQYYNDWIGIGLDSYRLNAETDYKTARSAFNQAYAQYQSTRNTSDTTAIEQLLSATYQVTKTVAQAVKSVDSLIGFTYNGLATNSNFSLPTVLVTQRSTMTSYSSQINSSLTSLLSSQNTINSNKTSVAEKTNSLTQTKTSGNDLSLESAQLNVNQRYNSLRDALETLADCAVKAPFDGQVAKVSVQKGDSASNGTTVATVITKQSLVTVSLNEVDIAKVNIGNKATVTLDAIEDLTISGSVAEMDLVGTVEQGVVSYLVTIALDVQDDRVKPGMSANATIITETKQDILTVPTSAIKTQGDTSYVEVFSTTYTEEEATAGIIPDTNPTRKTVVIGIADDTNTEIISGLVEGDQIVIKTVVASKTTKKTTTTSSTSSLFGGTSGSRSDTTSGPPTMTGGGPMP